MTTGDVAESFTADRTTSEVDLGVLGFAVTAACAASGGVLALSALFAIGNDWREFVVLAAFAVACGTVAYLLGRRPFTTGSLRPVPSMAAAVAAYLVVAGVSTLVYLAAGGFESIEHAAYESVAGVSTSALTVLDDPGELGNGLLVWRSGTQWIGGLGALALAVGLLPFLGGSRELAEPRDRRSTTSVLSSRPSPALRRVVVIYGLASALVLALFLATGMGLRDSVAHGFSSVSTGGFSTRADSIAHYDSWLIELAVIVAMAGAGSSVALVWMLWRRQFKDTRRAFELRVFTAVVLTATGWIWWLNRDLDAGTGRGLRESFFTVVSLATTTGHRIGDWGSWHPGASTLLLIMIAIGGMAGSVAGGLRWMRIIGLVQFVWRELQRQLHPRSVRSVKVGSTSISEASVDRMHSQLVYTMCAGTIGAFALALFGSPIVEALSLSVSAVSTTGPGLSDAGTVATAADLSAPQRLVLMPLMLAGRMFLYPAFVFAGAAFFSAGRELSRRRGDFSERRHQRRVLP